MYYTPKKSLLPEQSWEKLTAESPKYGDCQFHDTCNGPHVWVIKYPLFENLHRGRVLIPGDPELDAEFGGIRERFARCRGFVIVAHLENVRLIEETENKS